MKLNFQSICQGILFRDLSGRTKDVVSRRFGLARLGRVKGEKQTLETIGTQYGITRERVRQIENDGIKRLKKTIQSPECQNVFQDFVKELKNSGGLKKEDVFLCQFGGEKFQNHVFFLLTLAEPFQRFRETKDFHALWAINNNSINIAQQSIDSFTAELKNKKQLLTLPRGILSSHIEISKNILKNPEGFYGLKDWPEVNPKGVKDKSYIVLKKAEKPLHFVEISKLVGQDALCQTVHNELIKDPRFVLVGRGLYALKEWGYQSGIVKEVISEILKSSKGPLEKETVIEEVLKQRYVKPSTVLLNLQNKKYFLRNPDGQYSLREA
ncbi:MAG: sigma factor-like helix-turn-helix DNA-binding protein [Candidatus Nealsonbacteria bacterium]|nr:sigma factor-like helix-turn-helix DNA-binding protein [Candidatus Nealsonbacteria bacterium]